MEKRNEFWFYMKNGMMGVMFLWFKRSATPVMMKFTTSVVSMIMVIVKPGMFMGFFF